MRKAGKEENKQNYLIRKGKMTVLTEKSKERTK